MMQTPTPSRRVMVEQRLMLRQVLLLSVGVLALFILLFIVVLPAVLRGLGGTGAKDEDQKQESTFIRPPVLSAPVTATNSAQLPLRGFAEAGLEVIVDLNGNESKLAQAAENGGFEGELELQAGENTFNMFAIKNGQRSSPSQQYKVILDTEPPKLEVSGDDNQRVDGKKNKLFQLNGETEPGVRLYVNDRLTAVKGDGMFSAQVSLSQGENKIMFRAVDQAGNQTEVERIISFQE